MNPRTSSTLLRIAGTTAIVAALMAASLFVWNRLPYATDVQAPFEVHGSVGETVSGRVFSATVTKVGVAPVVKHTGFLPKERNIKSAGQWVVIKATVTALLNAATATGILAIDGKTYTTDSRLDVSTLAEARLDPLIPRTGVYVFQVGSDALEHASTAKFGLYEVNSFAGSARWDSALVIEIPLDPDHAPRASLIALPVTVVGKP